MMVTEIYRDKRYSHFYVEFNKEIVLKMTFNNEAKIYGIRLINLKDDTNIFNMYRLTNLEAISLILEGVILQRLGIKFKIDEKLLTELGNI